MTALLRLMIPACPPIPLLGGDEIVGGCVALALQGIRDRMIPRRDRLAKRYHLPPDSATMPASEFASINRDRLQYAMNRHQEYLRLSTAIVELEDAICRGDDLEVSATLFMHGRSEIEAWAGLPILTREFVWADCRACEKRYLPEACGQSDWSRVADPRAGIGGSSLACPAGHVIFAKQTWVA